MLELPASKVADSAAFEPSGKDARMVKDQEEQRARDATRKQRIALADARAREEDDTQPLKLKVTAEA